MNRHEDASGNPRVLVSLSEELERFPAPCEAIGRRYGTTGAQIAGRERESELLC